MEQKQYRLISRFKIDSLAGTGDVWPTNSLVKDIQQKIIGNNNLFIQLEGVSASLLSIDKDLFDNLQNVQDAGSPVIAFNELRSIPFIHAGCKAEFRLAQDSDGFLCYGVDDLYRKEVLNGCIYQEVTEG